MKKKQITLKIISSFFVFLFFIFFSQSFLPYQVNGANLNWENPNKGGQNPYKISTDAILNSQTMMQVVGCTGLVDKITTFATDFAKNLAKRVLMTKAQKELQQKARVEACEKMKKSAAFSFAGVWNVAYTSAVVGTVDCNKIQSTEDEELKASVDNLKQSEESTKKMEQCFNGLAYTLAKNQLTSMTRETINWINTGFNGDPMYVRNITSLTNSIERNILETGVQELSNGAFPFGRDFSESIIKTRQSKSGGLGQGAIGSLNNLTSDLAAFITDKDSYGIGTYEPEGMTRLEIAKEANDRFANDFSTGGWDGYLALTQRDQNNPLGFTMLASQYLADRMDQQSNELKDETLMGGGFMSQKVCTKWQQIDNTGKPMTTNNCDENTDIDGMGTCQNIYIYNDYKRPNSLDNCVKFEVVTPGSIIKEKLTTYINSPERQLELADTINKALNNLFTNLIQNFRNEGLFGLSREKYEYDGDLNMGLGFGSNNSEWLNDTTEWNYSGSEYSKNGSFDLTRDLGNTYNHEKTVFLGAWNAKTNTPELNINLAPFDPINKVYYPANVYYKVSVPGNTKLFNNGYNGWASGDRAFWNGTEWQNWKERQTSPIKKRGIIQIQNDYAVATKEILKKLPGVMPKLGELDYCIPGPNTNIQANSEETANAFGDLTNSITILPKDRDANYVAYSVDSSNTYISEYFNTMKNNSFNTTGLSRTSIIQNLINNLSSGTSIFSIHTIVGNIVGQLNSENNNLYQMKEIRSSVPWRSLFQFDIGGDGTDDLDWATRKLDEHIDIFTRQTQNDIRDFYIEYKKKVVEDIYGKMLSEFIEEENHSGVFTNTSYVPMAKEGYAITNNIMSYDKDISSQTDSYNYSMVQAEENTAKLTSIKNEVSKIIKDAQGRRDKNLLKIIDEENKRTCQEKYDACLSNGSASSGTLRNEEESCLNKYGACLKKIASVSNDEKYALYKAKYASCFEEEDILYYDDADIMNYYEDESTRCFDNIDNDLDRLIDAKDPDCNGVTPPPSGGGGGYCFEDDGLTSTTPNPYDDPGLGDSCYHYVTEPTCTGSSWSVNSRENGTPVMITYTCKWVNN